MHVRQGTSLNPGGTLLIATDSETKASVTDFARRSKAEGLPCEAVLVLLKDAVREATHATHSTLEIQRLIDQVVHWTVEAYYADVPRREPP